jgi:hypothetical protein
VYVLREHDDADLITMWNQTLPSISEECKTLSQNLLSIHLFRIGKSEQTSTPTIIVNTKGPLPNREKEGILSAISFQAPCWLLTSTQTQSSSCLDKVVFVDQWTSRGLTNRPSVSPGIDTSILYLVPEIRLA